MKWLDEGDVTALGLLAAIAIVWGPVLWRFI